MRQLVVLFKLIVLTAALAAGTSTAEPLAFQKHSISLLALSEAVTLRSDFDEEPENDEPADFFSRLIPANNPASKKYQLRTLTAQGATFNLPPARGPPLHV